MKPSVSTSDDGLTPRTLRKFHKGWDRIAYLSPLPSTFATWHQSCECHESRDELRNQLGKPIMFESATKISIEHLLGNRSFPVHKDDTWLYTFTRIQGDDKNVEHRFETSAATICFIRGNGKIAINSGVI